MQTDTDQTPVGDQERDEDVASATTGSDLTPEQLQEQAEAEERVVLMSRARLMKIPISNNIGIEKLRERIAQAMAGVKPGADEPETAAPALVDPAQPKGKNARQLARLEAMKLVRIHIVNLDPKKKDLQGEIITVANDMIGTVRKFVPYGEVTENGYHVPLIIYKMLKRRKFLNIRTRKGPKGPVVEQSWAQEFSIEVLPPLTKDELKKLASAQMAAGSVG